MPFVAFSARSFAVCCVFCTVLSLPFVAFSVLSCPCHLLHFLHGPLPLVAFSARSLAICCIFCTVLCHLLNFLYCSLPFVSFYVLSFAICYFFCSVPRSFAICCIFCTAFLIYFVVVAFSMSLSFAANLGRLTLVRHSSRKSSATHSYQCV